MEELLEWKVLKTCCDRLELIIKTSIIYSMNDYFCSIVVDEILVAATKGNKLFETISATIRKAIRKVEEYSQQRQVQHEIKPSEYAAGEANSDFDTELHRILPLFEVYMVDFKKRLERPKENLINLRFGCLPLTPPMDRNCFLTKNYTTRENMNDHCVTVKIEPREVKVVKRYMLYPNSMGRRNYIDESNVGFKMLLGLGWAGGPLGANRDGIAEPISVELRTSRRGLGCEGRESIQSTLGYINYNNLFQYLKQYADDDRQSEDLEFSNDFSHKEKKKLFGISKDLNLQQVMEHRNGILVVKIMKPTHNSYGNICEKYT